jgi:hypothetical protein
VVSGRHFYCPRTRRNEQNIQDKIDNPAGAKTMVLTFGLFDAGNDWWWAVDNILVTAATN